MPSIPSSRFTHQDVVNFLQDGTVPDGLGCSIGYHLMSVPVRMIGDTGDRLYEARHARAALEIKHENPFTRAPVTTHPALTPDKASQKDLRDFRAMLLGYAKVAAYFERTGDPARSETRLLPVDSTPGVSLQTMAAGQQLRNRILKRMSRRPVTQPRLPEYYHDRALQAREHAENVFNGARRAATDAFFAAQQAYAAAAQTEAVTPRPRWKLGTPWQSIRHEAVGLGLNASSFASEFGPLVFARIMDTLDHPTPQAVRALAESAAQRKQNLSDYLMFQNGALLRAFLVDRAYDGLAGAAHMLAPRGNANWRIGPVYEPYVVYMGQHSGGIPQGPGLQVAPHRAAYTGGTWRAGLLDGSGRSCTPTGVAAGLWTRGFLSEGTIHGPGYDFRGTFYGYQLHGRGMMFDSGHLYQGVWRAGTLIRGQISNQGRKVTFAANPEDLDISVGTIQVANGALRRYDGEMVHGVPNGCGVAIDAAGLCVAGHWENGELVGPGTRELIDRIQLGTWPAPGEAFRVEEELPRD